MKYLFIIAILIIHEIMYVGCRANGCYVFGLSKSRSILHKPPIKFNIIVVINNIMIAFILIWNLGVLLGLVLSVLHLTSTLHYAITWILSIYLKFLSREPIDNVRKVSSIYIGMIPVLVIILIVFIILSISINKYSALIFDIKEIIALLIVCIIGLFVGLLTKGSRIDNDSELGLFY